MKKKKIPESNKCDRQSFWFYTKENDIENIFIQIQKKCKIRENQHKPNKKRRKKKKTERKK